MRFSWGQLRLVPGPVAGTTRRQPASTDWLGNRYEWQPPAGMTGSLAFDGERLDTPPPDIRLRDDLQGEEFFRAWTLLETLAKLMNLPILIALRRWPIIVPSLDQDTVIELEGVRLRMRSGYWADQDLIFTCGQRIA